MGDRTQGLQAVFIVSLIMQCSALGLRFWSRSLIAVGRRYWWDDWVALACAPFLTSLIGLSFDWTAHGLGKHSWTLAPGDLEQGVKLLYAISLLNVLALALPKLSALFFYARAFGIAHLRAFRAALWAAAALVGAWTLALALVTALQCAPARKAWTPGVDGRCLDAAWVFAGGSVGNMLLDVLVLVLPLPLILRLQMERQRKLMVLGVFLLGYMTPLISLTRLIVIVTMGDQAASDISWHAVPLIYLAVLEPALSLTSISLPSIFSLFKRWHDCGFRALFTRQQAGGGGSVRDRLGQGRDKGRGGFLGREEEERSGSESDRTAFEDRYGRKCGDGSYTATVQGRRTMPVDDIELAHGEILIRKDVVVSM